MKDCKIDSDIAANSGEKKKTRKNRAKRRVDSDFEYGAENNKPKRNNLEEEDTNLPDYYKLPSPSQQFISQSKKK